MKNIKTQNDKTSNGYEATYNEAHSMIAMAIANIADLLEVSNGLTREAAVEAAIGHVESYTSNLA